MSNVTSERQERRPIILKGISQGLKQSEIATRLGVSRAVILNDIRFMRKKGDPQLQEAQEAQEQTRVNKPSVASISNERFQSMTGLTFQEKSFRNMIHFNRHALMKIINSTNQHTAIMRLPKSIRKTLKRNGIITTGWHKCEITIKTLDYLFG